MDIFKLIFEHDLRLDQLKERQLDRSAQDTSQSLEAFLKPDPTYSKFYLTGTVLPDQKFGLNTLNAYPAVLDALEGALQDYSVFLENQPLPLRETLKTATVGQPVILTKNTQTASWNIDQLRIDSGSNVGHKKEALADVLTSDDLVLYKEKAHQGFDLHLFSKHNIYTRFFEVFQKLVSDNFRYFSINGKRINSERKFYFETWTLHRPPHGAEEVFKETVL